MRLVNDLTSQAKVNPCIFGKIECFFFLNTLSLGITENNLKMDNTMVETNI